MNTFDKLLKADKNKADELPTAVFKSKRLAFIVGEDEPVDVTYRALTTREIQYFNEYMTDNNGEVNQHRMIDGNVMICAKAIQDPNVNDQALVDHFEAKSVNDLCEKLFQMEAATIASKVMELSGAKDDAEDEIKN